MSMRCLSMDRLPAARACAVTAGTRPARRAAVLAAVLALAAMPGHGADVADAATRADGAKVADTVRRASDPERAHGVLALVPGERLELVTARDTVPADGQSAVDVTVRALDRDGRPLSRPVIVTLETSLGRIATQDAVGASAPPKLLADLDRVTPGVQIEMQGQTTFTLLAPPVPGTARLVAASGVARAERPLTFAPDLRPMLTVGILEGIVAFDRRSHGAAAPLIGNDGLEDELGQLGVDRRGRDVAGLYGRGAFFTKGEVRPGWLVTAQYDSDEQRERFFRDIQPEQFYPIYGDSSLRGFDAQSTRRGYLRVDHGASSFLFGDFLTGSQQDPALSLGLYGRSLTGARQHFEGGRGALTLYGARDSARRVIDEQPGRGTSGPYAVSTPDGLANSEQVELIVRDRNQPSVILSVQPLVRYTDYEFEPFSGRLLFRRPVPSLDASLNPVSIRVTYEVDAGGPQFWVTGANATWRLADSLQLDGSYAHDDDPFTPYSLASANATWRPWQGATLVVEGARSERAAASGQSASDGDGWRAEFRHEGESLAARVFYGRTEASFDNPAATLNGGRAEAGGKLSWTFAPRSDLTLEALTTEDVRVGAERLGAAATAGHWFTDALRLDLGVRHFEDQIRGAAAGTAVTLSPVYSFVPAGSYGAGAFVDGALRPGEGTTARARVTYKPSGHWLGYLEGEQGLENSSQHALAAGGEYQVLERTRLFARHEYATGLSSLYGLDGAETTRATVVGADTEYMRDGQLFSEYRLRSALSGRDAEAAIGLRNLWPLREGLTLSTTLERVQAMGYSGTGAGSSGASGGASSSATGGSALGGYGAGGYGVGGTFGALPGSGGIGANLGGLGASSTVGFGSGGGSATAAGLGLEYTAPQSWKSSGRLEYRTDPLADQWLSTLAFTRRLSRDWSLLARNVYFRDARDDATLGTRTQDRVLLGAAYRDADTNVWNALARYELKHERDTSVATPLDRDAHVVSLHANWKPSRPLTLSGQLAGKLVRERLDGVHSSFDAVLASGRMLYDVTERWDAGVQGSVLASAGSRRYGVGIETGYVLVQNLWLSVGWNFAGFSDRDLVESDWLRRGMYLRLRFKFDEKLFGDRDPR